MKFSSMLMSSFAALLILISVHENSLKSTDFVPEPDRTVVKFRHTEVNNEATSAPSAAPVSKTSAEFSYLKFNVSEFLTSETGNDEMPEVGDFDYLKFKVSDYTETEIEVKPEESDFGYLKFDVNHYVSFADSGQELPSADFDYLKFDVQKYVQNESAGEINELPE